MADAVDTPTEYVPGEGDVEITLLGKKVFLKPTLKAALMVSRASGTLGSAELYDQVAKLNLDAIAYTVAAGMGKEPDEVLESVYRNGMIPLMGKCMTFIRTLNYGGRLPKEEPKGDGDKGNAPGAGTA